MKFTLSWLKSHLDTDATVAELSERLTMLGLEVEGIDDPAERLTGFITAHVVEAAPHPNADRLRLCVVEDGQARYQVVCGAPNARAGIKVVLATPGVVIPATGDVLKKGMVRGIESQAMMCSARELGLGEDHNGIIELPGDTPLGVPLTQVLPCDPVFDIAITPNRADCLSVRGVARDLAASGMGRLKPLTVPKPESAFDSPIPAVINLPDEAASACRLFAGRLFRGIANRESPDWLKARLSAIGVRPISALVDVTNYVANDLGQPLHVFDAARLKGRIGPRLARAGEELLALNGKTYALTEAMTVIADEAGAQSLAGVMGGEDSGVTDATAEVFLESALFDPMRTAATGRALGLDSEARYRFERGVDPAMVIPALETAAAMILELCGGTASAMTVAGAVPEAGRDIAFRPSRVARLGGVEAEARECQGFLDALGCRVTVQGPDSFLVQPPSWRADLEGEHDLVEEVLRLKGYDRIPELSMPRPEIARPVLTQKQRRDSFVLRALAARGLVQTVTWSFLPESQAALFGGIDAGLVLSNPISSDLSAMRPSLLPNLIAAAGRNADRGQKDPALFELGPQFEKPGEAGQKQIAAGVRQGRSGPRHWARPARPVDAFDAKADAIGAILATGAVAETSLQIAPGAAAWYHPGRSGAIKLGNKVLAWFGEVHPSVLAAMGAKGPLVAFELFLDALPLPKLRPTKAKALLKNSPFQPLERDFAFVLDAAVPAETLIRAARGADKALIADVALFDLYEGAHAGDGKKSLAIQVTLQPVDHTLTDAEIEAVGAKVVAAVAKATGGVLRG